MSRRKEPSVSKTYLANARLSIQHAQQLVHDHVPDAFGALAAQALLAQLLEHLEGRVH